VAVGEDAANTSPTAHMHRKLEFDVIGMTNVTEAKLAREA